MEQTANAAMAEAQPVVSHAIEEFEDFDSVVRAHQRGIYRVLLALLHDTDTADALTQECFLKAYEHKSKFRGECSARTWLTRIAVNLARDHVKSRRWQFWRNLFHQSGDTAELPEPVAPQASPERALLAREQLVGVWSEVDKLPNQQRAVFVLRFVEEMSIEEIAEATFLRPGTVKAHLFRATGAVRERLKERKNR